MKTSILLAAVFAASSAFAQTTIDQAKALAGNVTPGDTAGFPITISQPGSYKLTGNLTVPANTQGILITADNVTLDLNGFTVRGPVSCVRNNFAVNCNSATGNFGGIETVQSAKGTLVRNGGVRGFAGSGVLLYSGSAEDLQISENTGYGLMIVLGNATGVEVRLNGNGMNVNGGIVTRCTAIHNAGYGILAMYAQESLSAANQTFGFSEGRVRASVASGNGSANFSNTTSMGSNMSNSSLY